MLCQRGLLRLKARHIFLFVILCVIVRISGLLTHLFERDYYTTFQYPYNGDIRSSVQQLQVNQKPDIDPINSYDFDFITDCYKKCSSDGNVIPLRLVYVIKSAPENFDRRVAIRNTWGYEKRFSDVDIRTVFILGVRDDKQLQQQINNESNLYGDIVQANFIDVYFNNTIKTMMGLKWAVKFCALSKFYMFVDDDYYVSTKNVLRFIRNPVHYPEYLKANEKKTDPLLKRIQIETEYELPGDVKLYSGYVFFSSPHRHYTSKWYVSLEEYPYHLWPPYVTAGAYIVSLEALLSMYYTSFYAKHFRFDDVYLGILAKKAHIEPFHSDYFHFYKQSYSGKDYKYTIASHGYDLPEELSNVWKEQKSLGNA